MLYLYYALYLCLLLSIFSSFFGVQLMPLTIQMRHTYINEEDLKRGSPRHLCSVLTEFTNSSILLALIIIVIISAKKCQMPLLLLRNKGRQKHKHLSLQEKKVFVFFFLFSYILLLIMRQTKS